MPAIMRSREAYHAYKAAVAPARLRAEARLAAAGRGRDAWHLAGWCTACRLPTRFKLDWQYSDGETPNFRERLICPFCGLNNRQRFMAAYLARTGMLHGGRIYCYEAVTAFYRHLAGRARRPVTGSEYLGHTHAPGAVVGGLRHEDALALSFADGHMDVIVANDVYEHVPDIDRALAEAARVLGERGRLVFTVPFFDDRDVTVQRATLDGEALTHHAPPAYHGNPVSPDGSLVFYDFGWSLLARCRAAGFKDAYALAYYSRLCGHLGGGLQLLFVAER